MPVDGLAAARTLLSYDGIRGGYCLFYVWQAYKAHGASTGRSAPTATEAWNRSDRRHPGDRNPPPGVPVFWGPKASSNAGDVVISLGGGRVAATDWPRYGVTGICTIDERERQIGRPYLGWAECIFDQPVALPTPAAAGGTATPIPKEWDEMVSKEELTEVVREVVEGKTSLLFGVNRKLDETIVPGIEQTQGEVGGMNRKLDESVLPTLERESIRAAALAEVVKTLAVSNGSDPAAIEAAIERGVDKALDGLTLVTAPKTAGS